MNFLRPHPHRGDVIAAGAVPLSVAAFVIELRMTQWSVGARFVVIGLIAVVLLTMGWLAQLEGETPRPYHSVLLVAGLLPMLVTSTLLAELLGAHHPPGSGGYFWAYGLVTAAAVLCARRANSGICTLLAAVIGAVVVLEFIYWVFKPHGPATFRAILLVIALAYGFVSIRLRDRRRRHAVQLINAAGLLTALLGVTYAEAAIFSSAAGGFAPIPFGGGGGTAPFGWKLYLLVAGFALVAYAAVDREPGPAYIGVLVLLEFVLLSGLSGRGSLVGWPLFLLVIGAAGIAIGLRPLKPLPPEPPTPTVPLHQVEEVEEQ